MNKKIVYHILFWLVFFGIIELLFTIRISGQVIGIDETTVTNFKLHPYRLQLIGLPMKMLFFYCNLLVYLPSYIKSKSVPFYILKIFGTALCFYFADYLIVKEIYLKNPPVVRILKESYDFYLFQMLPLFYLIIFGASSFYFFINEWYKNEKQKREMIKIQLDTELSMLKYQVNPHFLFNTLNNLFSIAQKHHVPELEHGIAKLSGMMRFMIYDSNTLDIPLSKEVQYLKDYIDIYKLRIHESDNSKLDFEVTGDIDRYRIAPFLLIPLVENAFKHGLNFKYPSSVNILLKTSNHGIHFQVINTNHAHLKKNGDDSPGIGLQNVRKRLELIYPGKHTFELNDNNGFFTINLLIELS